MSANLASLYGQQFATNVQMLLQQKKSKLRPFVTEGRYKGEQASPVDQIGAIDMAAKAARFAAMPRTDATVDRRWVLPSDFELNQLIDSFDKLKMISDPQSLYVQNALAAANRRIDDTIIAAFHSAANTGKTGTTSTALPAGQTIAHASAGLTVAKLREAKKILMANEVDLETDPITAVITAEEHDDLLAETQIVSTDYNEKPVLVEGKVTRFLGINFVVSQRILTVAGTPSYRQVALFAKSGMHLGIWNDAETSVSKRNDLSGEPWQCYLKLSIGATRVEEKKVVEIQTV